MSRYSRSSRRNRDDYDDYDDRRGGRRSSRRRSRIEPIELSQKEVDNIRYFMEDVLKDSRDPIIIASYDDFAYDKFTNKNFERAFEAVINMIEALGIDDPKKVEYFIIAQIAQIVYNSREMSEELSEREYRACEKHIEKLEDLRELAEEEYEEEEYEREERSNRKRRFSTGDMQRGSSRQQRGGRSNGSANSRSSRHSSRGRANTRVAPASKVISPDKNGEYWHKPPRVAFNEARSMAIVELRKQGYSLDREAFQKAWFESYTFTQNDDGGKFIIQPDLNPMDFIEGEYRVGDVSQINSTTSARNQHVARKQEAVEPFEPAPVNNRRQPSPDIRRGGQRQQKVEQLSVSGEALVDPRDPRLNPANDEFDPQLAGLLVDQRNKYRHEEAMRQGDEDNERGRRIEQQRRRAIADADVDTRTDYELEAEAEWDRQEARRIAKFASDPRNAGKPNLKPRRYQNNERPVSQGLPRQLSDIKREEQQKPDRIQQRRAEYSAQQRARRAEQVVHYDDVDEAAGKSSYQFVGETETETLPAYNPNFKQVKTMPKEWYKAIGYDVEDETFIMSRELHFWDKQRSILFDPNAKQPYWVIDDAGYRVMKFKDIPVDINDHKIPEFKRSEALGERPVRRDLIDVAATTTRSTLPELNERYGELEERYKTELAEWEAKDEESRGDKPVQAALVKAARRAVRAENAFEVDSLEGLRVKALETRDLFKDKMDGKPVVQVEGNIRRRMFDAETIEARNEILSKVSLFTRENATGMNASGQPLTITDYHQQLIAAARVIPDDLWEMINNAVTTIVNEVFVINIGMKWSIDNFANDHDEMMAAVMKSSVEIQVAFAGAIATNFHRFQLLDLDIDPKSTLLVQNQRTMLLDIPCSNSEFGMNSVLTEKVVGQVKTHVISEESNRNMYNIIRTMIMHDTPVVGHGFAWKYLSFSNGAVYRIDVIADLVKLQAAETNYIIHQVM